MRASAPWYSDEIDARKKLRRKLERRWRKTKSLDDYNAYLLQCRRVQLLISSSKSDYYTSIIDEKSCKPKGIIQDNGSFIKSYSHTSITITPT